MIQMRLKFAFEPPLGGVWGQEPRSDGNDLICVRVADFDDVGGRVSTSCLTTRNISPSEQNGRILRCGDLLLEKGTSGTPLKVATPA
jgi:type I restriction enzyme S subunit